MNIKDFLDQPEIKELIVQNDLEAVYHNLLRIDRGDLSTYLLKLNVDPLDYLKSNIPDGAFFSCKDLEKVTIPDGLTGIGERAFSYCPNLKQIVISDSVTSIDDYAFYNSYNLTNVLFGENSQLTAIGSDAFYCCHSLKSITIPDRVTTIANNAFEFCDSLASITIPSSVATIGAFAFYECSNLTDIYYTGTEEQWNAITIGMHNAALLEAKIHFNS